MFAGAGVGIAGIDHDGLGGSLFHAPDTNLHRRGANLVGGEHARHGRRRLGNDERKVALLALLRTFAGAEAFDVAKYATGGKPRGAMMEPEIILNVLFMIGVV